MPGMRPILPAIDLTTWVSVVFRIRPFVAASKRPENNSNHARRRGFLDDIRVSNTYTENRTRRPIAVIVVVEIVVSW